MKFETFNLFNSEEKIGVNNTTWCNATTAGTCTTARYELRHGDGARVVPRAADLPVHVLRVPVLERSLGCFGRRSLSTNNGAGGRPPPRFLLAKLSVSGTSDLTRRSVVCILKSGFTD